MHLLEQTLLHNLTAKQSNVNSPECNSGDVWAYVSQPREGLNFALDVLFHIQPLAGLIRVYAFAPRIAFGAIYIEPLSRFWYP